MNSPGVKIVEYNLANTVSPFEGLYGLVIGNFNKGPIGEKIFVSSLPVANSRLSKPRPGSDVAYYILHTFLLKSRNCWTMRVANNAKYSSILVGASYNTKLGTGDGTTKSFSGTLPFSRCIEQTVSVWVDDDKVGYDNGEGDILGTSLDTSTVTYTSGAVSVLFDTAPPNGTTIYARWGFPHKVVTGGISNLDDYDIVSESIEQELSDGTADNSFEDILVPYPLYEPQIAEVTSISESTLVIYDGDTAIAYADEVGNLVDTGEYLHATPSKDQQVDFTSGDCYIELAAAATGTIKAVFKSRTAYYCIAAGESPGEWSDYYRLLFSRVKPDASENQFTVSVFEIPEGTYGVETIVETYNLSNEYKLDGFDRQMNMEERVNGNSNYLQFRYNEFIDDITDVCVTESIAHNVSRNSYEPLTMTEGSNGDAVSVDDYINALNQFKNKDDVKVDIIMDTVLHPTYQQEIMKFCDRDLGGRGDCYGILQVPFEYEESNNFVTETIKYRKYVLLQSCSWVGLYFGHVKIRDTFNYRDMYVPNVGFVGATFAYTADMYEPWFSNAGWRRGVIPVSDLYRKVDEGTRDVFWANDINCMKFKPNRGIALWGDKTLYGRDGALNASNVRWLLIVAENAIEDYMEDYTFELNDDITRILARSVVTRYLESIQLRRGLYSFDVVCDESNNTPEMIDNYRMNLDYYLQPTKPARHIWTRAVVTPTGVDFSDYRIM